ncbi:MAG TPA: FAD-binding oxidoreductase [Longimicrobiales bacterium]|nr:FAD-binding oxidoreductase [Longimicrobiales bacterium]
MQILEPVPGTHPDHVVNDVHSRLNATRVAGIAAPRDLDQLVAAVRQAAARRLPVAVAGGRHAMGGQQFCEGGLLIDMRLMDSVLGFDPERGLMEVEAGAMWPKVIEATHALQGEHIRWGIRQKQTGADDLTIGGTIAANGHGRGLLMQPFVDDVESVTVVTASGDVVRCSREENAELFSLVHGGYGLFGIVASATLRLGPRLRLRRLVSVLDVDDAANAIYRRIDEGCLYGDFQYAIEPADEDFLRRGVLAVYAQAPADADVTDAGTNLNREQWMGLLELALRDKRRAFQLYSQHYIATHGNVYWSDVMQLSTYVPSYIEVMERLSGSAHGESLVIGELYTPAGSALDFLDESRRILRETGAEDVYGTIRAIRQDTTSFLPWARQDFACVIFNLRTLHTAAGVAHTRDAFRRLNQAALDRGGSFFLTYGRSATRDQIERGYPRFPEFLRKKRDYDPELRFQSEWWRWCARMFE